MYKNCIHTLFNTYRKRNKRQPIGLAPVHTTNRKILLLLLLVFVNRFFLRVVRVRSQMLSQSPSVSVWLNILHYVYICVHVFVSLSRSLSFSVCMGFCFIFMSTKVSWSDISCALFCFALANTVCTSRGHGNLKTGPHTNTYIYLF